MLDDELELQQRHQEGIRLRRADRATVISGDSGNANKWMSEVTEVTEMVVTDSMNANNKGTDKMTRISG